MSTHRVCVYVNDVFMRDCVCFHVWVFFLLLRGGEVTRRVKIEAFRM